MSEQIDTSALDNIASLNFGQFGDAYRNGGNIARDYYNELALQGREKNNKNIENYAQLAKDVTTNDGSNGKTANGYSRSIAEGYDKDFDVGSENWLLMQFELMQNDLAERKNEIQQGESGELDYEQTNNIHTDAFAEVGLGPDAFTLQPITNGIAVDDPVLAQTLFEDLIEQAGLGDNMLMDGMAIDNLQWWNGQYGPEYYDWVINLAKAIARDPSILGSALAEEFRDFLEALGGGDLPEEPLSPWVGNPDVGEPNTDPVSPDIPDALSPLLGAPAVSQNSPIPAYGDPLVLDLDGNGRIDLVSLENSNASFDFLGDGYGRKTGWVAPTDGMLTIDLNGNGIIDSQSEMFSPDAPLSFLTLDNFQAFQDEQNAFAILASYDSNGDGVIDAGDDIWTELNVWQDVNSDGFSQADELLSLDAIGIASFDVTNYEFDNFVGILAGGFVREAEGNTITHHSSFTLTDGSVREIVDVWFDTDFQNTFYRDDYTLDIRALFLPTARGYGQIADLHIAMSLDNGAGGLLEQVQDFATSRDFTQSFAEFESVRSDVESILFNWAGLDATAIRSAQDYSEHGVFGHMPEFMFLRKFMGVESDFAGTWLEQTPDMPRISDAVEAISDTWENLLNSYTARLLMQTSGADLFENDITYNPAADVFEGDFSLSQSGLDALEVAASGHADSAGFWHAVAQFLDVTYGIDNIPAAELTMLDAAIIDSTGGVHNWTDVLATLSENNLNASNGGDTVNGSRWDDIITGGDGDDVFIGGAGDDEISGGGASNDTHIGGLGNDIYRDGWGDDIYQYDYGHDVIRHFGGSSWTTHDILRFGDGIEVDDVSLHLSEMNSSVTGSWHVAFEVEDRGSILLQVQGFGTRDAELIDELHFADGTIISTQDLLYTMHGDANDDQIVAINWQSGADARLLGHEGDDALFATSYSTDSNIYLDGGEGNDVLTGGQGHDTFFLSAGHDQVVNSGAGNNKILLAEGFSAEDVSFFRYTDPNVHSPNFTYPVDALITVEGLGSISILDQFSGNNSSAGYVSSLEFADGSTIDLVTQRYLTIGSEGDDIFNESGNWFNPDDTYLFGEGHDVIREYSGTDTILFADGYEFSDLHIYQLDEDSPFSQNNNLIIADGFGNSIMAYQQFGTSAYAAARRVEMLEFADGSTVALADLEIETRGTSADNVISGIENIDLSNDDTIFAYGGDDTISGLSGDDVIYAGAGNDKAYGGEGDDEIYGDSGNDVLSGWNGNDSLYGGDGNDELDGWYGNETLDGGAGSDVVNASYDDDVLVYNYAENVGEYDVYDGGTGSDVLRINISSGDYAVPLYQDFQDFLVFVANNSSVASASGPDYIFKYFGLSVSNVESLEIYVDGVLDSTQPIVSQQAPEAKDDLFYGVIDQAVSGNVLDNNGFGADIDFNGDVLSVMSEVKATSAGGSVTINVDGSFSYIPPSAFSGVDSFEYTLSDGTYQNTASVSVSVNDVLADVGTSGRDVVSGSDGANIVIGGRGDDLLYGNQGDDTYVWSIGDGNDTIADYGGADTLALGVGIVADDVKFWTSSSDFNISIFDETIKVSYQFTGQTIETLLFSDGSSLDLTQNLTFTDVSGANFVSGLDDSNDILVGGSGDDQLYGARGDDTYVWNIGDGNDQIVDYGGADTLALGAGIVADDVKFWTSSNDLHVSVFGEAIKVSNQFSGQAIETLLFADGSSLDLTQNLTFTDVSGANFVSGLDDSNDILVGGFGDDQLYGARGDDTYVWNIGDGNDQIVDYGGVDTLSLGAGIVADDVKFFKNGYNLEVSIGVSTLTVANHFAGQTLELLSFYDGSIVDLTGGLNFSGNPWEDTLHGTDGDDVLSGFAGDDALHGYEGDDTYVYNTGDGSDIINETGLDIGDTISLGEGIDVSNVSFEINNFSSSLNVYIGAEVISVTNQYSYHTSTQQSAVETLRFYDGSSVGLLNNMTFTDANNDGYLIGLTDDNVLIGGAGDDLIHGGAGDDTYVYNTGDGSDIINETGLDIGDTISLGEGIDVSNVSFEINNFSSSLNVYIGAEVISVTNQYSYHTSTQQSAVEALRFYDGSSVGLLNNMTFTDANNDGYLIGLTDDNVLIGGAGDDIIYGYAGNDTSQYFGVFANYTIIDHSSYFTVSDTVGLEGMDTLHDIEMLSFADGVYDLASEIFTPISTGPSPLTFNPADFTSYTSGQDLNGGVSVNGDGRELTISGNVWKQMLLNYDVTADTLIEFDYRSTEEGELQGFVLETDNDYKTGSPVIQLYGRDDNARFDRSYDYNGSGEWQSFSINASAYVTGLITALAFVNDDDRDSDAVSMYRNFAIYEGSDTPPVNTNPVAQDDSVVTDEDTAIIVNALGNDSDADSDPLSVSAVTQAANGSVVINGDNTLTYTPDADFNGADSFTYTVDDGQGGSDTATVNVSVDAVNDNPEADDDAAAVDQDGDVVITLAELLSNDSDVDGDALSVISISNAVNGTAHLSAGQHVTFTPDAGFFGMASFDYVISDGNGGSDTATVDITVNEVTVGAPDALVFDAADFTSYSSGQDLNGGVSVNGDGSELTISGNAWKKMLLDYDVTADTIIEFDYSSPEQGELQGFVLETDNDFQTGSHVVQLYGRDDHQRFDRSHDYDGSGNWQSFSISAAEYVTGAISALAFVNDDDRDSDAVSMYRNFIIYERDTSTPEVDPLDLGAATFNEYSDQNIGFNAVDVVGTQISMDGNAWMAMDYSLTVTENSYLSFGFSSDALGEIHGIGFDTDNDLSTGANLIKLYGTQNWGQDGPDYAGGGSTQTFMIKLSDFYNVGSTYTQLVFANDDDASKAANSVFDNVRIYEDDSFIEPDPVPVVPNTPPIQLSASALSEYSKQNIGYQEFDANADQLDLEGNIWLKMNYNYTVTADSYISFDYSSSVQGEIHAIGLDTDNSLSTGEQLIKIYGTQEWGQGNLDYDGSGDVESYVLKLSDYYTIGQTYTKLVFANDDDGNEAANGIFNNVRLFEFDTTPSAQSVLEGDALLYGDDDVLLGGDVPQLSSAMALVNDDGAHDDVISFDDPLDVAIADFVASGAADGVVSTIGDAGATGAGYIDVFIAPSIMHDEPETGTLI